MPPFHYLIICLLLLPFESLFGQADPQVNLPSFDDQYSKLVKQLEGGQTEINYKEFRESFLQSEQFKVAGTGRSELDELRKKMHELMQKSAYKEIVEITKKMLSIDYTDIEAHKILQKTYKLLGDGANQKKYHDIEFGLFNSILKSGDGKTPETAWHVIQVAEEYFILDILNAKLLRQSVDATNGVCDKMEVETDKGKKTYYFDVSKVFQGYKKEQDSKQ